MIEITREQKLHLENLMSFRGKVEQNELDNIERSIEEKIRLAGAQKIGNSIIATYGMDGSNIDMELLIPIDKRINDIDEYKFKDKVLIVNAVKLFYKGNPAQLNAACNKLNQYILDNKLQPITVGYNVTKYVDPLDIEKTEIEVYVGLSPNIL